MDRRLYSDAVWYMVRAWSSDCLHLMQGLMNLNMAQVNSIFSSLETRKSASMETKAGNLYQVCGR